MKRLTIDNRIGITNQIRSYLEKNSESKFIHRLHVILLFADTGSNESCDSLGTLFGISPRSISNWIKKINQTGDIESLRSIPPSGRPPRLTQEQKDEIRTVLQQSPEKQGIQDKYWRGKNLSTFIYQRYGLILTVRSCQFLLHKAGFSAKGSTRRDKKNKPHSKAFSQ